MKDTHRQKLISKLLEAPPVEWPAMLHSTFKRQKLSASDMDDLRRTMDDACERLAFLSGYVTHRFGCGGCGEKTPADAAKHARKTQSQVTSALGYYPQYRWSFFSSCEPEE